MRITSIKILEIPYPGKTYVLVVNSKRLNIKYATKAKAMAAATYLAKLSGVL